MNHEDVSVEEERLDLLAQVAVLYFEDGLNQDQIAKLIGKSRSMVSRMLDTSRKMGLIDVRVNYSLKRNWLLESKIKKQYGLKDVYLLNTKNIVVEGLKEKMLGNLAAQSISSYLKPGIKIGIGRSRILYRAFSIMQETLFEDSTVVQMSGYTSVKDSKYDGIDLVRKLAEKIGGNYIYCPAPLIVSSEEVRESFFKEEEIKKVFDFCSSLDLAIVGVGSIKNKKSSLIDSGFVDAENPLENNVEGDILGWQIDTEGNVIDLPLNKKVIALSHEKIKKIPTVIAVGAGEYKAGSFLAGIKGHWFNTLISDDETVEKMLEIDSAE